MTRGSTATDKITEKLRQHGWDPARRAVRARIAEGITTVPGWDHELRAGISAAACIGAGVLLTLLLIWTATDPSMPLAERLHIAATPLDRIDITLLQPLNLHLDGKALVQGLAGGTVMYVLPFMIVLLRAHLI